MGLSFDAKACYEQAVSAYQAGQIPRAVELLEELVRHEPDNDFAVSALGGMMLTQQRYPEAQQYFEKALSLNPNNIDASTNLSILYGQQGRFTESLALVEKIALQAPERIDIQYNYATALMQAQKYQKALPVLEQVVANQGDFLPGLNALSSLYAYLGNREKSIPLLKRILELDPNHLLSTLTLGNLLVDVGQTTEAEELYLKAIDINPGEFQTHALLGKFYADIGNFQAAKKSLHKAIELKQDDSASYLLLGNLAKEESDFKEAERFYKLALRYNPNSLGGQQNLRRLYNRLIPAWHFTMLADEARNDAYQRAIEKAIGPNDYVLDIGTGSGLLSMMAARAGARQVVACEMHEKLAEIAQKIVTDNNYEDKITVYPKKSTELKIGQELSERADVIVSEILDCGAIGEGVLPSVRHAIKSLAKEKVRLIPSKVQLYGQLIEIPARSKMAPIRKISGFDLSAFEQFRIPNEYIRIELSSEQYRPLSEVIPLEEIDFYKLPPAYTDDQPFRKSLSFPIIDEGEAQAIVFWFDLNLDSDIMVSTHPDGVLKHWGQSLFCFEEPHVVNTGQHKQLQMLRSDHILRFSW